MMYFWLGTEMRRLPTVVQNLQTTSLVTWKCADKEGKTVTDAYSLICREGPQGHPWASMVAS